MAAADLQAFLDNLLASQKKKAVEKKEKKAFARPKGRVAPKPAYTPPTPAERLESPSWKHESIVYLVTTTRCRCGAVAKQTNPIPLVRRVSPIWQVHEEALELSHRSHMLHTLPVTLEEREVEIENCHECLPAILDRKHGPDLRQFLALMTEAPMPPEAWYWFSPANQYCMELPLE